jgi:hypothetical protein
MFAPRGRGAVKKCNMEWLKVNVNILRNRFLIVQVEDLSALLNRGDLSSDALGPTRLIFLKLW